MVRTQTRVAPAPTALTTSKEILAKLPAMRPDVVLRPIKERVVKDIVREVRRGVPAYAQPVNGELAQVLTGCVERAVEQVVEEIGNPDADRSAWESWFRHVGRLEYLEGRTTDSLQTAVRIGARVGWRHMQAAGAQMGLPASVLFRLADALFLYADDVSALAVAGYAEAKTRAGGDLRQRRQRLLKLIVADPPIAPQAIAEQAALSEWTVPKQVAVIALDPHDAGSVPELGRAVLDDLTGAEPCVVVGDPERQLARVERVLAGRTAAIGPTVQMGDAPRSLACARRTLDLIRRGVLGRDQPIRCAEHLPTLAMYADEFVLGQLREHALRPFAELTPKQRERLCETLQAWLSTRGGINEVADRLGVHPQTVRYRMNQVNDLLGPRLDDPDERLMLEIALRAAGSPWL